jgi:hypothetical protein
VRLLVQKNKPQHEEEWERLAPSQKNVLRAVAAGSRQLLSAKAIRDFSLGSIGGVQAALKSLLEMQYLMKSNDSGYSFENIWFRDWIKMEMEPVAQMTKGERSFRSKGQGKIKKEKY